MRGYYLFLDDIRIPLDAWNYTHDSDFLKQQWIIARSYNNFVRIVEANFKNDLWPEMIAFDHDLDDAHYEHLSGTIPYDEMIEKTGFHCAQWLVDFCIDNNMKLPPFKVHSMNPAGKINIVSLLENFKKHQDGTI